MHEHQCELQHSVSLTHDPEDCQDEIDALRRCLKELEATTVPLTFTAVAAASGDKPLTRRDPPAPPASTSMGKKPAPIKSTAGSSTVPAAVPPATLFAGLSDMLIPMKDKGMGHALPGPYIKEVPKGIPYFEEDPYRHFLLYDNDKFDDLDYNTDTACVA